MQFCDLQTVRTYSKLIINHAACGLVLQCKVSVITVSRPSFVSRHSALSSAMINYTVHYQPRAPVSVTYASYFQGPCSFKRKPVGLYSKLRFHSKT
jgi:hypothetical protein